MNALHKHAGQFLLPALYYHAVVGFPVDCTDMETLKALHLVIQTTIAFPPLQDFSTELW